MKVFIVCICIVFSLVPVSIFSYGCYDYYRTRHSPYDLFYLDSDRGTYERTFWFLGVRACSSLDGNHHFNEEMVLMDEIMPQIEELKSHL